MAPSGSKARLLVFTPQMELRVALEGATTSVGSDPRCTLSLPSVGLAAHHCVIQREGDEFEVFDLSGKGLQLNGKPLEASALRSGDHIQVGDLRMVFLRDPAPTPGEEPPAPASGSPPPPAHPPAAATPPAQATPAPDTGEVIPFAAETPAPATFPPATPAPSPAAPEPIPEGDVSLPQMGRRAGRIALGPLVAIFGAVQRARRARPAHAMSPALAYANTETPSFDLHAHHHPAGHRHAQTWGQATIEALRRTPYIALSLMVHALLLFVLSILSQPIRVDRTLPPHESAMDYGAPSDWDVAQLDEETEEVETEDVQIEEMEIVDPEIEPVIADSFESDYSDQHDDPVRPFDAIGQGDGLKGLGAATAGSGITLGEGAFGRQVRKLRASGLDIVFVIDSTGSMSGLLSEARASVETMVAHLSSLVPGYRLGLVTFRDQDDEYLTRKSALTPTTYGVVDFLDSIEAAGGGDHPEAVLAGLRDAITSMRWSPKARKVVILVGDAPPHLGDKGAIHKLVRRFTQSGGVVHTIFTNNGATGSGEDERSYVQIAKLGKGVHVPLGRNREVVTAISRIALGADHGADMARTLEQSEKSWKSRIHKNLVDRADAAQILAELNRRPPRESFLRELMRNNKESFLPAYLKALENPRLPQQTRWACCVLIRRLVEHTAAPRRVVAAADALRGDDKPAVLKRHLKAFKRVAESAGFAVEMR